LPVEEELVRQTRMSCRLNLRRHPRSRCRDVLFIIVIVILGPERTLRNLFIYWYGDAYDGREDVWPLARGFICKLCAPVVPWQKPTWRMKRLKILSCEDGIYVPDGDCFRSSSVFENAQEVANEVGHRAG
jgi:hypothetical protein